MKILKNKVIIIILIIITILQNTLTICLAAIPINSANLKSDHSTKSHIEFERDGIWVEVRNDYICYLKDGNKYPAYCVSHGINGVDQEGDYTVNVSELLNNEKVWRTIVNGYPYVSAASLGLENNDQAYVATKQAVFSVMLDRDVKSFYRAQDAIGEKVIEAIYNISEKGKKGTQKYKTADITIQQMGDIGIINEKYYIQYQIKSDIDLGEYKISQNSNLPEGAYITDVNNNKKSDFKENENFRIIIPKENFNKDLSAKLIIKSKCKTYPIFFGKAPSNNLQNYAITYDAYEEFENEFDINIKTNKSKIKIIKKDEETSKPIEGIKFSLTKDSITLETKQTNKNGIIEFDNLYQGTYILKEIDSGNKYILNNENIEINLEYKQIIEKEITNKHKKGSLKIIKVDADNTDLTLGAIEFDLINSEGKIIEHLVTNVDGEVLVEDINIGNYILKETKTKKEYNICVDENLEVKWNELSEYVIKNEKKKGQIKLIKEDEENSKIKLEGVIFQILDKNNIVVDKITTDRKGEAISKRLPIGEYTVKELSLGNNENYILDSNVFNVNIQNNIITPIIVKNKHKTGILEILKIDKDTKTPIEGVKFEIIDSLGTKQYIKTNENGIAYIENIKIGSTKIKELETKEGYELSSNEYELEIKWNELNKITIENERKKGQVEIYKVDKENNNIKLQGVEFNIIDKNKNVVDTLVTNKNGYAISKKLPIGKYILIETKTHNDYILNHEEIKLEIKSNEITTYNISNKRIKGKIKVKKTSKADNLIRNIKQNFPIEGVIFEIYNLKDEKIEEIKTDKEGIAISSYLSKGVYKIRETYSTDYYFLNEKQYIANIREEGEIVEVEIQNNPHIPKTDIEKVGMDSVEAGAEIHYEFDINNTGNVELSNFKWTEYIPYKDIKITKMQTGIYSQELEYELYYKTNKNDYKILKIVNTFKNEYIDFTQINLDKNEEIIELKVEYGTVEEGFCSIENPILHAIASDKLKDGDRIVNKTRIEGLDLEYLSFDEAEYITTVYKKDITKKLPRTGG